MNVMNVRQVVIADLVLDQRNPRIAPMVESLGVAPTSDMIKLALGKFSSDDEERSTSVSFTSLKESIRTSKGVMQPIIVTPNGDGKYAVIEGNTRVAIYMDLAEEGAEGNWESIPAIVHEHGDERGEHAIRLQAHLVGPRPWRPYAKAKYLHDLYHSRKLSIAEIHAICGGSGKRREIEEYIAAYTDMQAHYAPLLDGNAVDQKKFSAFVELQKPAILESLAKHGYSKDDFAKWIGVDDAEAKLKPLQIIRQLPRILNNTAAKQKFLARNAEEALRLLEQPASSQILKDASIEQLASALAVKLRNLSWAEAREFIEEPDSRASLAINDCYLELDGLNRQINPSDE